MLGQSYQRKVALHAELPAKVVHVHAPRGHPAQVNRLGVGRLDSHAVHVLVEGHLVL